MSRQPEGGGPRRERRAGVTSLQAVGAPRSASDETLGAPAPTQPRRGRKQRWLHHLCGIAPKVIKLPYTYLILFLNRI